MVQTVAPSWRKPAAIAAIFGLIAGLAAFVASVARFVGNWPVLVQAIFYLAAGLIWIAPLKPLLRWAERRPGRKPSGDY
jgi:membrane protein implicated in regulation of membrane protease activity